MPEAELHRIGWAVSQAKSGQRVTRKGWRVAGQSISYVAESGSAQAYLAITTRSGKNWPFTFGQRDILAEDWMLAS